MRIALFAIKNILGCHYGLFGYRETLERMGHEVLDCSFPSNAVQDVENIRRKMPSITELCKCHAVLSTYHEYVQPWLAAVYGLDSWNAVLRNVPVVARFDESMDRADLGLPGRMPELKRWAQYFSFPAAQDARKFGGEWHPFGADTTIFKPGPATEKKYDIGFIGSLYPERAAYLQKLAQHIDPSVTFRCGQVFVQDLSGIRERESTELLAENYRNSLKIFFCLPPLSHLIVEKVFDVMASNTLVFYPRLFGDAAENLTLFEDFTHIVYYDLGYVAQNAKQIKYFLEHPEQRETIAHAGGELVRSKYTLEMLLNKILALAEVKNVGSGSAGTIADQVRI